MAESNPTKLKRNQTFHPKREPLQWASALRRHISKTTGPFGFLNPTRAYYSHVADDSKTPLSDTEGSNDGATSAKTRQHFNLPPHEHPADKVRYIWTSRNNRKGRHQLEITPAADPATAKYLVPDSTNTPKAILENIGRMFTNYPVWDVSWIVAYVFTWGSVVWVINAFFVWLPLVRPSSEFKDETTTGAGVTAFIGATIFEVGSFFLMFEAVNENRTGCFGWAVEQVLDPGSPHKGPWLRVIPDKKGCRHHHQNRSNLVGKSQKMDGGAATNPQWEQRDQSGAIVQSRPVELDQEWRDDRMHNGPDGSAWVWFPSWQELREHYFHQIGFLACTSQLFGASVFWISGLTALPGILNNLTTPAALNGAYWAPQIIGGSGFVVSGTLFMLETQERWWKPNPAVLGWHIGLWNLVGGVGFTLCPCFGIDTASWAQYQACLSTFWGSWAFLVGSLIQLYESLQKHPIDVNRSGSSPVAAKICAAEDNNDPSASSSKEV